MYCRINYFLDKRFVFPTNFNKHDRLDDEEIAA